MFLLKSCLGGGGSGVFFVEIHAWGSRCLFLLHSCLWAGVFFFKLTPGGLQCLIVQKRKKTLGPPGVIFKKMEPPRRDFKKKTPTPPRRRFQKSTGTPSSRACPKRGSRSTFCHGNVQNKHLTSHSTFCPESLGFAGWPIS